MFFFIWIFADNVTTSIVTSNNFFLELTVATVPVSSMQVVMTAFV